MTDFILDPNSHQDDAPAKIVFALERLSHVFRINWWEKNKTIDLSPLQMQILVALRFHPDINAVSAIAHYLMLTYPTVSDAVRVLTKKGYVEKRPDSEDGRRSQLSLTNIGLQTAEELAQFGNDIRDFINTLPNQGQFLESLLQLMKMLQVNGDIPLQQMCTTCRHFGHLEAEYLQANAPQYYCNLLELPLAATDLRIHCPEHEISG